MADTIAAAESEQAPPSIFNAHRKTQALVLTGSVLSALACFSVTSLMHLPQEPRFQGSLFQQNSWVLGYIAICILLAASAGIGTVIAGQWWLFSGLFTACVGLAAISTQFGPLHYVIFDALTRNREHTVFLRLALEHCILMIPLVLLWLYFWERFTENQSSEQDGKSDGSADLYAVAVQVIVMGILVSLLVASDEKQQALVGVFVAGAASAALAESISPTRNAPRWYWLGTLIVGLVGYLLADLHPDQWATGFCDGAIANLAHAMPLDLASSGLAGTLIGYWAAVERPHVPFRGKSGPDKLA